MYISKEFFNWISTLKISLACSKGVQSDISAVFKEFFEFLDWVNEKITADGLLSLEDDLHNDKYKAFVEVFGDTSVIDSVITLFCDGVYGDDNIPVLENFILYSVSSKEKELAVLLIEAIHHIIAKDISYKVYKSFWRN